MNSSSNYTRFSLHVSVTPIMSLSPVAADSAIMAEGQCPLIDPKSKEKLCTRPEVGGFFLSSSTITPSISLQLRYHSCQ